MSALLDDGSEARIVRVQGDRITIRARRAAAPGEPVGLRLPGGAVRLKTSRCVRDGDVFVIEGRLLDATKKLLGELAELLSS